MSLDKKHNQHSGQSQVPHSYVNSLNVGCDWLYYFLLLTEEAVIWRLHHRGPCIPFQYWILLPFSFGSAYVPFENHCVMSSVIPNNWYARSSRFFLSRRCRSQQDSGIRGTEPRRSVETFFSLSRPRTRDDFFIGGNPNASNESVDAKRLLYRWLIHTIEIAPRVSPCALPFDAWASISSTNDVFMAPERRRLFLFGSFLFSIFPSIIGERG